MKKIFILLTVLCLFASCDKHEQMYVNSIEADDTIYAAVNLNFTLCSAHTKMRSVSENLLSDYNIFVFNSFGHLVERVYKSGTPSILLRVNAKEQYDIYVVANAGEALQLNSKEDIFSYEYSSPCSDGVSLANGGVIMVGCAEGISIYDGCTISVELKRRVAQIVIFADTSRLFDGVELNFEQITLKNAPSKVRLFGESKVQSAADVISYTLDVENITASGAKCYMYENLQGNLKPSNMEQQGKVLAEGDIGYGVSTYIELKCRYKSVRYEGTIYYKFYLGEDMLSNFDVRGNTRQNLNICFKGNASVRENSWRVDTEDLTDNSIITFAKSNEYMYPTDTLIVRWGKFFTDDQMPNVVSSDPQNLKILKVSDIGVEVAAVGETDALLEASLGERKVSCSVNVAYPKLYFSVDSLGIDLGVETELPIVVESNKREEDIIVYERLDTNPSSALIFPYGNTVNKVIGNIENSPNRPILLRAYFRDYPTFDTDIIKIDIGKKTN